MCIKILYLSGGIIPSMSANSVHIMKMCQAFAKNGFEVELLAYSMNTKESIESIFDNYGVQKIFRLTLLNIKNDNLKFPKNVFKIFSFLNKHSRDTIVYGRDINSILLAALLGFKVYYETHSIPVSRYHATIEAILFKSKNLIKVIVISEKLKSLYADLYSSASNKKIITLHDAADIVPPDTKKANLGKGFHVGYAGSLHHEGRGIDLILMVAKKNMKITFHLVGGSYEEIKKWKEKAPKNVVFHGFVVNRDLPSLLLCFDIVLMPYQTNLNLQGISRNTVEWMSPMKMFEYMSAKKAIVSSDLPVIREILNEKNSLLVSPKNVDAWSLAIRKLYFDRELIDKIASEAYQNFLDNYTWDQRVQNLSIKAYKDISSH